MSRQSRNHQRQLTTSTESLVISQSKGLFTLTAATATATEEWATLDLMEVFTWRPAAKQLQPIGFNTIHFFLCRCRSRCERALRVYSYRARELSLAVRKELIDFNCIIHTKQSWSCRWRYSWKMDPIFIFQAASLSLGVNKL